MISCNCSAWLHFIFKGYFHFILYNCCFVWVFLMTNSKGVSFKILLSNLIRLTTRKWRNYRLHLSFPFYQPCVMLRNSLILSAVGSTFFGAGNIKFQRLIIVYCCSAMTTGWIVNEEVSLGEESQDIPSLRLITIVLLTEDSRNIGQEHKDKQPGCYRSHNTVTHKKDINLNIYIKWVKLC